MRLHAERSGAGAPRLVLVHGFTQTGRSWSTIAADLARDHEVVLVDAPGHGGSGAVDADLPAGAALLGQAGGRGVYVGYSMGGRLALHLALAEPALVDGLVLLGATAGIDDPDGAGQPAGRRTRRWPTPSSATASTRSSSGGWPARCSPGSRPMPPGSTSADPTRRPASLQASGGLAPAPKHHCGIGSAS